MPGMYGAMKGWPARIRWVGIFWSRTPTPPTSGSCRKLGLEWRKDPWATWARAQKAPTYDHYVAAASERPDMDYVTFLSGYTGDLQTNLTRSTLWSRVTKILEGWSLHFSGF